MFLYLIFIPPSLVTAKKRLKKNPENSVKMVDYYPVIGYNIIRNKERGNKNDKNNYKGK